MFFHSGNVSDFGIDVMLAWSNKLEGGFSASVLLKRLWRISITCSLYVW